MSSNNFLNNFSAKSHVKEALLTPTLNSLKLANCNSTPVAW